MVLDMTEQVDQPEITWVDYLKDSSVPFDERLDRWEEYISQFQQTECPLTHSFPEGMYVRKIVMPADSIVISRIHKFDNPFFITKGRVSVASENEGAVEYVAPYFGITKQNTRRILFVHEETEWATVHLNLENIRDIEQIEANLTYMKPSTLDLREQNKMKFIESGKEI